MLFDWEFPDLVTDGSVASFSPLTRLAATASTAPARVPRAASPPSF